jgi:uncharacterized membrane protein
MKRTLETGIGVGIGVLVYDYISQGEVDWIRGISIAIIASAILFVFSRFKKTKSGSD